VFAAESTSLTLPPSFLKLTDWFTAQSAWHGTQRAALYLCLSHKHIWNWRDGFRYMGEGAMR